MKKIFVTGISTDVGKTIASAIITEALQADYWKPVQAGDLDNSDSIKVKKLISNPKTVIHPNSYALHTPMSPHAAAEIDGVTIALPAIKEPVTKNHLVIEGAGGLLVPLNSEHTIMDIIQPDYRVIVVSRHYLGSINHTLLTLKYLQDAGIEPVVLFSGDEHPTTESIIAKMGKVPFLGRITNEPYFDRNVVKEYADTLRDKLQAL
ncbi:dethiobiotin synthase [Ascidiimonas aurantiaca]|uniref:dethiobiotin synthase n=1 Tax=Ascidiimonas aurantiaca TaxID=1685432 RepID=UPI0030EE25C8